MGRFFNEEECLELLTKLIIMWYNTSIGRFGMAYNNFSKGLVAGAVIGTVIATIAGVNTMIIIGTLAVMVGIAQIVSHPNPLQRPIFMAG